MFWLPQWLRPFFSLFVYIEGARVSGGPAGVEGVSVQVRRAQGGCDLPPDGRC